MIKKKFSLFVFIILILLVLFSILTSPKPFYAGIINTLTIWLYNVYPSIFTFYIISSCLINFNILSRLTFLFKPLIKFSSNKAYELFIISILIGNPSSASLVTNEFEAGSISEKDANKLIKISSFFNPLYIISIMTTSFLGDIKYALLIVLSMIITSILFSYLYSSKEKYVFENYKPIIIKSEKIFNAISSAMYLLIIVCGIMVFTNILKFSITNFFNIIKIDNFFVRYIIANFDAATGVFDITNLHKSTAFTLPLICFILTFQGISINLQVATVVEKLNLGSLLITRILQGIISALICLSLYILIFT